MAYLKSNGIPRRIDSRSLHPAIGNDASRVVSGFMGNGWVDDGYSPSDDLRKLINSYRGDSWRTTLKEVLPKAYAFIVGDWEKITRKELHAAFVSHIGQELPVAKSCERFFLSATAEAGYNLSEEFDSRTAHLRPLLTSERPLFQSSEPILTKAETPTRKRSASPAAPTNSTQRVWEQLIDLIDDPEMPEPVKAAAFTLISYFKQRERHDSKRKIT